MYLVPIDRVANSTPDQIILSITRAELAECPLFEKTTMLGADGATQDADTAYVAAMSYTPGGEYPGMMYPPTIQEELVPDGELSIHPGARVEATDGHVGDVHEFVIDPTTERVTHVVLPRAICGARKTSPSRWIRFRASRRMWCF